ncbi:MAG: DapH/DapD/GlmU-related protein [Gallionella sp.]|jgi:acetyltransferase-like isoleucine patch superfamily enzyme
MIFSKNRIVFMLQPWKWPEYILWKLCKPIPSGLVCVNFIFQRIFGINREYPFPVNFTSRVNGDIKIGSDVWISLAVSGGCYIQGGNGVEIGDGTLFGPGVKIISANHSLENYGEWDKAQPIKIGKNVWIGANVVILPGVQIGDGAVIGAGAVVTKSISDGSIAVGNPAREIKRKLA